MKAIASMVALGLLAGCATSDMNMAHRANEPMPGYYIDVEAYTGAARLLARECPRLALKQGAHDTARTEALARFYAEGYYHRDFREKSARRAVRARADAVAQRYNLNEWAGAAEMCRVAEYEIARGGTFGPYLALAQGALN